ncbi:MAG: hypothetical protein JWP26_2782 [Devosia sp.]|uniref:hypothetical protein n=1 Tax=Devosia sp. TaxID=1871048 RepID=UPI002621245F|nr:hypothetical protein [Devosia sp.]MDB5587812.1 hypothetical protein [Devosia sp.]
MAWTERWGISGEMAEVERELGLVPGRYSQQPTDERVTLPDPIYPKQSQTFFIDLMTDAVTGKVWKLGLNEITNGVYALIYQPFGNPN